MTLVPVLVLIFAAQPVANPQAVEGALAVSSPASAGVTLVDGQRPEAMVVIPAAPTRTVRYAADESVYHVRKATGVTLAVVGENAAQPRSTAGRLYLGSTGDPCPRRS